jgi:hypothetical protein
VLILKIIFRPDEDGHSTHNLFITIQFNALCIHTVISFSKVAAWKDEDGDWYETGLHIFCMFIIISALTFSVLYLLTQLILILKNSAFFLTMIPFLYQTIFIL